MKIDLLNWGNLGAVIIILGLFFLVTASSSKYDKAIFTPNYHNVGSDSLQPGKRDITIPIIDISKETERHVVIAKGTDEIRQGHPSTLLLPDGKTIFCAWTHGHGGAVGPLKKSTDGGKTWSDLLDVPENWSKHENCPSLYRLIGPEGNDRLFIFANRGPQGHVMYQSISEDDGETWSLMKPTQLADGSGILGEGELPKTVMPFTAIETVEDGKAHIGVTNARRVGQGAKTNVIVQSRSTDGGLTWDYWRVILDLGSPYKPCEPEIIRSPDGEQLLMIIRENNRSMNSWIMVSNNEGKSWSKPFQTTASVTMDRHQALYAPDGRLAIVGRDVAEQSPTKGHFVAWVGKYKDLLKGKEGQYRIKLLHSYTTTEYPGLELLPDGTFVATNSVGYRPDENYSVVSTRFKLEELDERLK